MMGRPPGRTSAVKTPSKPVPTVQKPSSYMESSDACPLPPAGKNRPESSVSSEKNTMSKNDLSSLSNDNAFSELLFLAQAYLKKTFRPTDCDILGYWYLQFNRSYEIVEYLWNIV